MSNTMITNHTSDNAVTSQIANCIANGKNIPVITIVGGGVALAIVGLFAYAIHKGVRANLSIKNGISLSFAPEPDISFAYIENGIGVNTNT